MTEASVATPVAAAEDEGDESQYLLHSRLDIAYVLRDIVRTRALARVHYGAGTRTLLTPLIAVDTAAGELLFDRSANEENDQGILRAHKLLFYCAQDKVKVRFATGPARTVQSAQGPVFAVSLPEAMLRLQRRDNYRLLVPVTRPVVCSLTIHAEDRVRQIDTRLHDISQGGVALIAAPGDLPVRPGAHYPNCRIVLPEVGNVIVTLALSHMLEMALLNARSAVKAGCEFVRASPCALALVQRYMLKLEREQRART